MTDDDSACVAYHGSDHHDGNGNNRNSNHNNHLTHSKCTLSNNQPNHTGTTTTNSNSTLPHQPSPPSPPRLSQVGILRSCVYVPRDAVSQSSLEVHDGVSKGKYTIGLGQTYMSVVNDCEDVISLALTVVTRLIEETGLSYKDIGRLDVGTETILDKSKSIKSCLMQQFVKYGNSQIEGLDTTNACYGSTAALFNALTWLESTSWDGRYAIMVATDIAVYEKGPARPTGGAGAIALLLGYNAPIRFEPALRVTIMGNCYDFFKPNPSTEYPTVRGTETIETLLHALGECYTRFKKRASEFDGHTFNIENGSDYWIFHCPFNKMVRRSLACLMYCDFIHTKPNSNRQFQHVEQFRQVEEKQKESTLSNRDVMRAFVDLSTPLYNVKCADSAWFAQQVGNCYTASLYSSLIALIEQVDDQLMNKRIVMFAFGSGFAASMFSLRVVGNVNDVVVGPSLKSQISLTRRRLIDTNQYEKLMRKREEDYGRLGYKPETGEDDIENGTFYLTQVCDDGERKYKQKLFHR